MRDLAFFYSLALITLMEASWSIRTGCVSHAIWNIAVLVWALLNALIPEPTCLRCLRPRDGESVFCVEHRGAT